MGELALTQWVSLFWACHNIQQGTIAQWCWPEDLPVMRQPALTVEMFKMLRAAAQGWVNDNVEAALNSG